MTSLNIKVEKDFQEGDRLLTPDGEVFARRGNL